MKFCRVLQGLADAQPPDSMFRQLHGMYKQLKKSLKRLPVMNSGAQLASTSFTPPPPAELGQAEAAFTQDLVARVQFVQSLGFLRQQQCVQTLENLVQQRSVCQTMDQLQAIFRAMVDFHGQTLLLMHWSILANLAVIKVLKKHHKRVGFAVQSPQLKTLLSDPSWSTETTAALVSRAEAAMVELQTHLFSELPSPAADAPPANEQNLQNGPAHSSGLQRQPSAAGSTKEMSEIIGQLHELDNSDWDSDDNDMMGNADQPETEAGTSDMEDDYAGSVGSAVLARDSNGTLERTSVSGPAPSMESSIANPPGNPEVHEDWSPTVGVAGGPATQHALHQGAEGQTLLQQMQLALQTWEYLQLNASTPSTVLRPAVLTAPAATAATSQS